MLPVFAFVVSLAVTMVLIPPLMRAAGRLRAVDLPNERKVHSSAIPRVGGIAMVAGAVLPILLWVPMQQQTVALLFGMAVILLFGFWDDRVDLDYRWKLAGQLLAALLVVVGGHVTIERIPFFDGQDVPAYASIPLTVVVIVGVTNAINLADGLDGLAGGTTLLSLVVIALLAHMAGGQDVVMISVAVIGATLGFLRFNTYPARVFMGDTGSQFLGFSAGVLAIVLTQRTNLALSAGLPFLLLGLAILDTLTVMFQRIYEGRSPFSPDKNHIHHRLLALGFDHYEAVVLIYLAKAGLVSAAYLLRYESDALVVGSYLVFCVAVLGLFRIVSVTGWRLHHNARGTAPGFGNLIKRVRAVARDRAGSALSAGKAVRAGIARCSLCYLCLRGVSSAVHRCPVGMGRQARDRGVRGARRFRGAGHSTRRREVFPGYSLGFPGNLSGAHRAEPAPASLRGVQQRRVCDQAHRAVLRVRGAHESGATEIVRIERGDAGGAGADQRQGFHIRHGAARGRKAAVDFLQALTRFADGYRNGKRQGGIDHRCHGSGRGVPGRIPAGEGLRGSRHQAQGVVVQHRPHRPPVQGPARDRQTIRPALW
jgi:UDP-N-acetylmuramyl pentapeptide phosphotransferase/UDP-N-acetylglucosamine-1-phosphate transferase